MSFGVAFVAHPELYAPIKESAGTDLTRYERAKLISPDSAESWRNFSRMSLDVQRALMRQDGRDLFKSMLDLVMSINDLPQLVACVLTTIDGALVDDKDLVEHLISLYQHPRNPVDMVNGLKRIMRNPSSGVVSQSTACHVLSLLLSELVLKFGRNSADVSQESHELVNWIVAEVNDNNFEVELAVYSMVPLFKVESLRFTFLERGGIRVV
jgi:hypothetical protein